ncbi:MAG: AgmX/PglI C-terminal domain-containing protein [Deltaproteobacteria bacterium]|nr:AgmX/PglI C-terminal domain-containing protein [Deltaproteobacteria bacterium]
MRKTTTFMLLAGFACSLGCSFMARDTPTYEADTSQLLDTRGDALQACYDQELAQNPSMAGKLTLTFTVEKKTGKLTQLSWDKDRTTVSESLATCVITALDGLQLTPEDQRDGVATFTYTFRNNQPAAS